MIKIGYKFISIIIIICFISNDMSWAIPTNVSINQSSQKIENLSNKIFIPEKYGRIEQSFPLLSKQPLVVLIKDAHCNYEAQKNISKILDILIRDYKIDLVCIEGASGKVDTSVFQSMPIKEARQKACDVFTKKGYLTASEALSICKTSELPFVIWGVEDTKLYVEDFKLFRRVIKDNKEASRFIEISKDLIIKLKDKIYNSVLKEFDCKNGQFNKNEISLMEWLQYLSQQSSLIYNQTNCKRVLKAIRLEENIDFEKVEKERESLIKDLEKKLTKEELRILIEKSLLFKLGKISTLDYYTYIEKHIMNCIAETQRHLHRYIHLIKLQSLIDEDVLFKELFSLQSIIFKNSINNKIEESLHSIDERVEFLGKLFDLQMSRNELDYYYNNKDKFVISDIKDFLVMQARSLGVNISNEFVEEQFIKKVEQQIVQPEAFYRLARKRDEILVHNLIKKMKRERKDKAIIIAGGFHSDGIRDRLQQMEVQNIVINPTITKMQKDNTYMELMLGEDIDNLIPKNIGWWALFGEGAGNLRKHKEVLREFAQAITSGYDLRQLVEKAEGEKKKLLERLFELAQKGPNAAIEFIKKVAASEMQGLEDEDIEVIVYYFLVLLKTSCAEYGEDYGQKLKKLLELPEIKLNVQLNKILRQIIQGSVDIPNPDTGGSDFSTGGRVLSILLPILVITSLLIFTPSSAIAAISGGVNAIESGINIWNVINFLVLIYNAVIFLVIAFIVTLRKEGGVWDETNTGIPPVTLSQEETKALLRLLFGEVIGISFNEARAIVAYLFRDVKGMYTKLDSYFRYLEQKGYIKAVSINVAERVLDHIDICKDSNPWHRLSGNLFKGNWMRVRVGPGELEFGPEFSKYFRFNELFVSQPERGVRTVEIRPRKGKSGSGVSFMYPINSQGKDGFVYRVPFTEYGYLGKSTEDFSIESIDLTEKGRQLLEGEEVVFYQQPALAMLGPGTIGISHTGKEETAQPEKRIPKTRSTASLRNIISFVFLVLGTFYSRNVLADIPNAVSSFKNILDSILSSIFSIDFLTLIVIAVNLIAFFWIFAILVRNQIETAYEVLVDKKTLRDKLVPSNPSEVEGFIREMFIRDTDAKKGRDKTVERELVEYIKKWGSEGVIELEEVDVSNLNIDSNDILLITTQIVGKYSREVIEENTRVLQCDSRPQQINGKSGYREVKISGLTLGGVNDTFEFFYTYVSRGIISGPYSNASRVRIQKIKFKPHISSGVPRKQTITESITIVPAGQLKAPKESILRALFHIWESWQGDQVFDIPLYVSDHRILYKLSYLIYIPAVIIGLLLSLPLLYWFVITIACIFVVIPHYIETRDGLIVSQNAKRYIESKNEVEFDEKLLVVIDKFIKETGWEVVYTDSPDLLIQPEKESKRVIVSIGFIVKSDEDEDRRIKYLSHYMHIIRDAILYPDTSISILPVLKDDEDNKSDDNGALKDMGDENPVEVPEDIKERWKLCADDEPNVKEIEIKGLKIKANFQTAYSTMPLGMTAYHFYDNAGNLVIITRDKLGKEVVVEEAVYHEAREDYWEHYFQKEGQDIVTARQIAHILAAVEEVIAFSEDGVSPYGITLYHIQQLNKMPIGKLLRLSKENRQRHHRLIERYLGKSVLKKMIQYEKKIQIMAERLAVIIESDRGYNPILGTVTRETLWDVVSARLRMTLADPDFSMEQWKTNNPEKFRGTDAAIEGAVEDNKGINRYLYGISKIETGIVDINNPKYNSLYREVRVIVSKLLRIKGYNPEDIELYISMDEEVNASVYEKSNKVFINIGLIRYFIENGGSVDSIAFIIAHELDHIDQWADDLISGKGTSISSTNADERDADIRALRIINDAGFSVRGALDAFELLDKYEKSRTLSATDKMLGVLSHPLTPTRIKYLRDMIIKLHWSSYFTKNTYFGDEARLQAYITLADYRWREKVELLNNVDSLVVAINEVRDISELFFVVVQGCESVFKSSDLENPDTSGFSRIKREFENKLSTFTLANTGKTIFYNILAKCLYKIINISITSTRGIISDKERDNLSKDPEFVSLIRSLTFEQLMEIIEARLEFILPFKTNEDRVEIFPKGYNRKLYCMYNYSLREVFIPHLVNNLSTEIQQGRITINDYLARIMPELIRWREQLDSFFHLNNWHAEYLALDIDRMHTKLISQLLIRDARSGYVTNVDTFMRLLDSWSENYFRVRDDNSIDVFLTEYLSHAPDSIKMAFTKWLLAKCKKEFTPIFIFKEDIVYAIISNNYHEVDPFFGANINERIENVYGSSFFNLHNSRRKELILHLAKSIEINDDNRIFSDDAKEIQRLKIENYATVCTIAGKYGEDVYHEIMRRGDDMDSAVLDWELEQVGFIPPQISGFNYSDPSLNGFKMGLLFLIKKGEIGVYLTSDGRVKFHRSSRDRYFDSFDFNVYLSTLPSEVRRYTYGFLYPRIYDFLLVRKDRTELNDVLKKSMQDEFKKVFGALAIDYIIYKHGGHQLDDSEFGSFISRVGTLFGIYVSKEILKRRRNNKNDIALSINFLNKAQMSLNEILSLFSFIDDSPYSAEIILSDLCEHLLDSEYRNIAIYLTILKKKLIGEWGLDITESEYFNLDVVKAKIFSQLGESQKQELFGLLGSVGVNLIDDDFMSIKNIGLMESVREEVIQDPGKLTQFIRETHEREVESYPSVTQEEHGGCLALTGVFTSLLVEDELTKYIEDRERTFSEKRDCVLQVFKYKSNTRDKFLLRLITDESNGEDTFPLKPEITPEDLYSLLNEFNNIGLRDIFALKALELERVAKPYLFETLDGELNRIQYYFPKFSNNRDDIIKQVIDERVTRPEDLKKCEKLLLQHPDNIRNTDTANYNLGKDYYDIYVKSKDPAVKSGFLMWIVGLTDVKPDSMIYTEFQFKKKFDVLREMFRQRNKGYYKRFGQTNREEFLSSFLTGENGILSNATSKSIFLNALFNAVMPGQSNSIFKVIYDSVFKEADLDRQCEILLRLLDNLSNFNVKAIGIQEEKEAKAIRVFLESLGLIGVKLGQFIAGESGMQKAIRKELRELRDRAKSIEKGVVFDLIAKIYGNNAFNATDGIFSELGIELGSASIKVVYKARLRDGRVVVVKVKRPEALKMIEAEILLLKKVIEDVKDKLRDNGIVVPENIVDRISGLIYDELNFSIERENQKKLGRNLMKRLSLRNVPGLDRVFLKIMSKIMPSVTRSYNIYIPQPVTISGTDENNEVIIEEFAEGAPLKNTEVLRAKGFNDSQILDIKRSVVIEIFKQIFVDGFFHADPHMGNILVREPGDIAFIDVGVAQEIGLLSRWKFIQLIRGIKRSNLKMVKKFVNSFGVKVDEAIETRIKNEVINTANKFSNKIMVLFDLMHNAGIRIPQDMLTLFRVFIVAGDLFDEAISGTGITDTGNHDEPRFTASGGAIGKWRVRGDLRVEDGYLIGILEGFGENKGKAVKIVKQSGYETAVAGKAENEEITVIKVETIGRTDIEAKIQQAVEALGVKDNKIVQAIISRIPDRIYSISNNPYIQGYGWQEGIFLNEDILNAFITADNLAGFIALFHEAGHLWLAESDENIRIILGSLDRKWYDKKVQKYGEQTRAHYALRALQKQLFGKKDKKLTAMIRAGQLVEDIESLVELDPQKKSSLVSKVSEILDKYLAGRKIDEGDLIKKQDLEILLSMQDLDKKFELVARIAKFINSITPKGEVRIDRGVVVAVIEMEIIKAIKETRAVDLEEGEKSLLQIAKKIGEEKGISPSEIQSIFDLFKQGKDILTMDPDLDPGQIDGSYLKLLEEIAELTGININNIQNAFKKGFGIEISGRDLITKGKTVEGSRLFNAAKRLEAYNKLWKDVKGIVDIVSDLDMREVSGKTVVAFHLEIFKDISLIGLKAVLNNLKGKGNVKLGIRVPLGKEEEVRKIIGQFWELREGIVYLPEGIEDANKVLVAQGYKNISFAAKESESIPDNMKIFGVDEESAFHAVFLFGIAYAQAKDKGEVIQVINLLKQLGMDTAEVDNILTEVQEKGSIAFFKVKLIRIREVLEEFGIERNEIGSAA